MLLWIIISQLQVWEFRRWFGIFLFGFSFLTTFLPLQSCCYVYTYTHKTYFSYEDILEILYCIEKVFNTLPVHLPLV